MTELKSAEDAERWAAAEQLLRGEDGGTAARRLRRSWWIWGSLIGLFVVVGVVVGLVAGAHSGHHHHHREPPLWREIIGWVLLLAGLVVLLPPLFRHWRSGQAFSAWRSPSRVLSYSQRRQALKQVRGQRPVEPGQEELLCHLARRIRDVPLTARYFLGVGLIFLSRAAESTSVVGLVLCLLPVAAYAACVPLIERDRRRAEAFLAKYDPA